jgi:branched-chain amino acid transport system substrate-binding protein
MLRQTGAAIAFAATGAIVSAASAQTVKVGIILTYSGADLNNGQQIDRGLRLYMKEHENDLPAGVKVELVVKDDGGPNPDVAKRLAQELIVRDKVNLIAGLVWTPNAAAIAPLVTQAKIPLVLMNAASSGLPRLSPYIVRTSYTLWQFAFPMGEWSAKHGARTAYTAVPDFVPGHEIEAAFEKGFVGSGGHMVGSLRVPLNALDYVPFLQRVKDTRPDVFYLMTIGGARAASMLKTIEEMDFKGAGIKVMGSCELVADDDLPRTGDIALGVVSSCNYTGTAQRPPLLAFEAAWKRDYGKDQVPMFMSVGGWDGMDAIFDLIRTTNGKFDGDTAMPILANWKNDESPRGPVWIDPQTRDIVQNVYIRRVEKHGLVPNNYDFDVVTAVKDPWARFNASR